MIPKCSLMAVTLLLFGGLVFQEARAEIPAEERTALIALYNSTDGDNWTNNSGWKAEPLHNDGFAMPGTEDSWYGIEVDFMPVAVEDIDMGSNNLSGTIPPELGNLSNLHALDLSSNQLTGEIPEDLGDLSNLGQLDLGSNQLTGAIPTELGNLSSLWVLNLRSNQLSGGIPEELGNLSSLKYLYLRENELTGSIPPALGSLSNLTSLDIKENHLTGGLPAELGSLSNVTFFFLGSNSLSGEIPTSYTGLSSLQHLGINYNALHTDDEALDDFLVERDSGWAHTQTIAPEDVTAIALSGTSINVSWTRISFRSHSGGYRVMYSTVSGGPYTFFDMTEDKWANEMIVTGLNPLTPYFIVIQTRTEPHDYNSNQVDSEYGQEVTATTLEAEGNISGRVAVSFAGHSDLAVRNGTVSLQGTAYTNATDENGDFTLEHVPGGTYTLKITAPDLAPMTQEVSLSEGESKQVSLPLMTVSQGGGGGGGGDPTGDGELNLDDAIYILEVMCGERPEN